MKILIAKLGLDGHDRGAQLLCRYLRDSGMEVYYTGIRQTPHSVAQTARRENPDVIGISMLNGAHNTLIPQFLQELQKEGLEIPVILGGIIPKSDMDTLKSLGIREIFSPGASLESIVKAFRAIVRP